MQNQTVYEWEGVNSHSMSWLAGTGPGLYKQIVVKGLPHHHLKKSFSDLHNKSISCKNWQGHLEMKGIFIQYLIFYWGSNVHFISHFL